MRARAPEKHADPWLAPARTTLEVVIGGSYATFLLAHAKLQPDASWTSLLGYWLIGSSMILLPLMASLAMRLLGAKRNLSGVAMYLGLLGLALLPSTSLWHHALCALTFALGWLFIIHGQSRPCAWLLALAPAQVLCAMAAAPSTGWLLLVPLAIGVVCAGVLVQSARHNNARLWSHAPKHLLHELERRPLVLRESRVRIRAWLPTTLLVLGLTGVFYPFLAAIPQPALRPGARNSRAARAEREAAARQLAASDQDTPGRVFGEELIPGSGLSEQSQEVVMTVKLRRSSDDLAVGVNLGQQYLRGALLDTFTELGMRYSGSSQPSLVRDEDDGLHDGWTTLSTSRLHDLIWIDIEQQSFRTKGGGWEVLFAPQPLYAIRSAQVHYDPSGLLAFRRGTGAAVQSYTLVSSSDRPATAELSGLQAMHTDERYTQLPRRSSELEWIEDLAEAQTAQAKDDIERVQAVLAYFKAEYEYSLKTRDVPGIAGITSFMRRGRGHCTSFAATSVLMLRLLGIPARVATGFLAREWSEVEGQYLVSTRNGHAWIEVYFEGSGWRRFDPTPTRAREEALLAADLGEDRGLGAWIGNLRRDLTAWAQSGADEEELELLLATVFDGPRAALSSTQRYPLRAASLLMAVVIFAAWRRRGRKVQADSSRSRGLRGSPERSLVCRLLQAIENLGVERRAGETLRELARRTAADDPELEFAIAALYRARFSETEGLQDQERTRINDWITVSGSISHHRR